MAWILIIASLISLWIIYLCQIILVSRIPFAKHFKQKGRALQKRNALLVIAHPDDESMFFTPTINFLTSRGHTVQILCLSIGDAVGKGNIRKQELFQACVALKVIVRATLEILYTSSNATSEDCQPSRFAGWFW